VAKFFDSDRFRKSKRGKSSFNTQNSEDPEQEAKVKVLPIDRGKRGRVAWPVSTAQSSLSAGAAFLLVIGILCGLYLSGSDEKPEARSGKPDASPQASAAAQASVPVQRSAKPSPIVPADRVLRQGAAGPSTASLVPAMPAPVARYVPTRFAATHKKVFGGCAGQLELTASRLRFSCRQDDLDLPVDAIAKAHKDGIVLKSGEKYHFTIANHTKDQVEAIFISWLNRVQQSPQPPERASAF
jgi:hypothetical protein